MLGDLSDEFLEKLEEAGEQSNQDYLAITPEARPIIEAFRNRVGR
jgi:hypothetical protein